MIVPAYNEATNIAATVRSLVGETTTRGLEVIVVDDGSTDAHRWTIVTRLHPARRAPGPAGTTPAKARARSNTGIRHARGDLLRPCPRGTPSSNPDAGWARLVQPLKDPRVGCRVGQHQGSQTVAAWLGPGWQHLEYVIRVQPGPADVRPIARCYPPTMDRLVQASLRRWCWSPSPTLLFRPGWRHSDPRRVRPPLGSARRVPDMVGPGGAGPIIWSWCSGGVVEKPVCRPRHLPDCGFSSVPLALVLPDLGARCRCSS